MTPTEVASAVIDASDRQAAADIVSLGHPTALERFKERQLLALGAVPWQDLKNRAGPKAKKLQTALASNHDWILTKAYRVASLRELQDLPASQLVVRQLEAAFMATSPATREYLSHVTIVGAVERDPRNAYVVLERRTRVPGGGAPEDPIRTEVMTIRKDDAEWRSMLDAGLVGLGAAGLYVLGAENSGAPISI